jgi:hypothetical protein
MYSLSLDTRIVYVVALLGVILGSANLIHASHGHHKSSSEHGSAKTNGDELLPAVCENGETMTRAKHEADVASFKNCKYQRKNATDIFHLGFDINGDGGLDKEECNLARSYYLSGIERLVLETCDEIFDHCDCDGDGKITTADMEKAVFTCLRNCQIVEIVYDHIAARMKGRAFQGKQ